MPMRLLACLLLFAFTSPALAEPAFVVDDAIDDLFGSYCYNCHENGLAKGGVQLDHLGELTLTERLKLMDRVQEQVYLKLMPPTTKARTAQPSDAERQQLIDWLSKELRKHDAASFEAKLRLPHFGNYVEHDKLFSGEVKDKASSPARRWLISPYIFQNRISRIYQQKTYGKLPEGIVNPFHLPDVSGIRYFDNELADGGHFLTMLSNAEKISYAQLGILSQEDILANEEKARLLKIELEKVNNSDLQERGLGGSKAKSRKRLEGQFAPKRVTQIDYSKLQKSPNPFDVIVQKDSPATQDEIKAAIGFQFSIVYQRDPSESETASLTALTQQAIGKLGNAEGLRSMLVAVLLQPDMFYRSEFGAGQADAFGRKKLTPREASYAIAYALTERDPDSQLLAAARSNQLNTKEEYKKHIERLLEPASTKTKIDPRLHSRRSGSLASDQVVKLRFFREFFGYSKAYQVFKDKKRFEGGHPDEDIRHMITDADLMVEKILASDQDVFNQLLTTKKFYLYHNGDNEATLKLAQEKQQLIADLLAKDWKTDPETFYKNNRKDLAEVLSLLGAKPIKPGKNFVAEMDQLAAMVRENPRTPMVYTKDAKYRTSGERSQARTNMFNIDHVTWEFQPVQPFEIPNRMGMLTHPAWLTAHSLNVSTDPVRRGKWVREKLLAGFVPDVPISVDAAIPEDHNKTLRQRVESKTEAAACYHCHEMMNPLGYPFEMFDDFGRFRTAEELEYPEHLIKEAPNKGLYTRNTYKTLPLDTRGSLDGTGDPALDGEVTDAIDLITRLGKSERVRQSIIRHTFRFFMGRNETLSDSQTLIDADQAYLSSGGSFNAVIISLLTSDSFMYRKEVEASK